MLDFLDDTTTRRRPRTPVATAEQRSFKMHASLLMDIIQRQAGTLAKGILEGVMNSIDAGCTKCLITIKEKVVTIEDDGEGITERVQIEEFFDTFGQPHEEKEKKTYGTFRMGRGQMFAYGVNIWRTGPFEMLVDVKNKGLDYDLRSGLKKSKGCAITIHLYDPLLPSDLADAERTLRKWVKYAPAAVRINGKQANIDPETETWDEVTDQAYLRLSSGTGSLSLYNLGIHTMDFAGHRFGVGGTVVSRRQLRVNFARNDVQSDCPVWKKIKPLVDQYAGRKITKKPTLNDAERQRLCDLILQGDYPDNFWDLKLFTAVNGRHYSVQQIYRSAWSNSHRLTHCPLGNQLGDKIFQQNLAFVVADVTLEHCDCTVKEFAKLLAKLFSRQYQGGTTDTWQIVDFAELTKDLSDQYDILADDERTATETLWHNLVHYYSYELRHREAGTWKLRKLVIGVSEIANGWTDGETYIAISRNFLKALTFDVRGITEVGLLLAHEHCHEDSDTATHTHSQEFYENFHNTIREGLPEFVAKCLRALPRVFHAAKKDLPRAYLKNADNAAKATQQLRELLETATEEETADG